MPLPTMPPLARSPPPPPSRAPTTVSEPCPAPPRARSPRTGGADGANLALSGTVSLCPVKPLPRWLLPLVHCTLADTSFGAQSHKVSNFPLFFSTPTTFRCVKPFSTWASLYPDR